ncbi:MAG: hypothetical protein M0033_08155 [Nitrospiraceae bacterium]|nr:hypothetical protein [Nitrospiraceae bacterium]
MSEPVNKNQLFATLAKFYREALRKDKAGRALAQSLGLDGQVLDQFTVGYANGSLLRAIPSKGGARDILVAAGLIAKDGSEAITGSLVVPTYDQYENVVGFFAASQTGVETAYPATLSRLGVNLTAFAEKEIVFTSSVLESIKLNQAGLVSVPVGLEVADEEKAFTTKHRPDKAYFTGELPEFLKVLQKLEVPCYKLALQFPASAAQVEQAIKAAGPIGDKIGQDVIVRVTDDCVRFECGARKYEVKELAPGEVNRLRVRIQAQNAATFHLDTLDLYSGRSRTSFARATAPLFSVSEAAIESDLCLMIRKLEAIRTARKRQGEFETGYVMTPDEEAEALEYLKKPDTLARVVKDLETMGYVGEEVNKKIGYLITISRKLESPLSGVIISRAGAGKSRLMEVLAEFVPPEDLVSYTRITPQALYYAENRSLRHKLMISGEDEGLLGSDYAIRELISSKKIKLAAPVKDTASGKMKTVEYEVEGPIALLFSTTQPGIHYENSTRCFTLSLDESPDQTQQVHHMQSLGRTLEGLTRAGETRDIKRLHRNIQRLLKPVRVVNPYAPFLTFPVNKLEYRREYEKYLSLIEAVAFLRQYHKEVKKVAYEGGELEYIEVGIEDIEEGNKLMTEILGAKASELSRPSSELLSLIKRMVEEKARQLEIDTKAYRFNRRDIREYTGWSDNQIKAHIGQLEELEYLLVGKGERGRMYRYELAFDGPETDKKHLPGLMDAAKLQAKVGKLGMVGNGWAGEKPAVYRRGEAAKVG